MRGEFPDLDLGVGSRPQEDNLSATLHCPPCCMLDQVNPCTPQEPGLQRVFDLIRRDGFNDASYMVTQVQWHDQIAVAAAIGKALGDKKAFGQGHLCTSTTNESGINRRLLPLMHIDHSCLQW